MADEGSPSMTGLHIRRGLGQMMDDTGPSISGYHVRRGFGQMMASVLGCGISAHGAAPVSVTTKFLSLYQVRASSCARPSPPRTRCTDEQRSLAYACEWKGMLASVHVHIRCKQSWIRCRWMRASRV